MKTYVFLVINKARVVKMTQNQPTTEPGEVAMKVFVEVPDAYFQAPVLQASVKVPEGASALQPISADVQEAVAQLIREATGHEVKISVEIPEPQA